MSPILGVIVGLLFFTLGMITFFKIPKDFKFKLAVLGVSSGGLFGVFPIALGQSEGAVMGMSVLALFGVLSLITGVVTLITLFLFFMRPNLVIKVKAKAASTAVDIRRSEHMNATMGAVAMSILLGGVLASVLPMFVSMLFSGGDMLGLSSLFGGVFAMLALISPIILFIILIPKGKANDASMDSGFAEVIPTDETDNAIREIGAIINDVQKLGDMGVEKWIG
jgi:hypothetical protein